MMMNRAGEQESTKGAKEKSIDVIMSDLEWLAERAEKLADRIADRLACISLPERSSLEKPEDKQVEKAMPPLFADIRTKYRRIQAAFFICEDAINRLEV